MEQVPHDFKVVIHFPAAPHNIAQVFKFVAVAGAAGDSFLFQNVNTLAFHLPVPHQVAGGGKGRQAAADNIGGFIIHAFWFFGLANAS